MKRVEGVVLERHAFGKPGDDGEYPCVVTYEGEIRMREEFFCGPAKQRWKKREAKE